MNRSYLFVGGPLDGQFKEVADPRRPVFAYDEGNVESKKFMYTGYAMAGEAAEQFGAFVFTVDGYPMGNATREAFAKAGQARRDERLDNLLNLATAVEQAALAAGVIDRAGAEPLTTTRCIALVDDMANYIRHVDERFAQAVGLLRDASPFIGYLGPNGDIKERIGTFLEETGEIDGTVNT